MSKFQHLREVLDERAIAQRIALPHDEARLAYKLQSNTVRDAAELERVIGDYYAHHHGRCVSPGGRLPDYEAVQRAKRIIDNANRRRNQTFLNTVSDAVDGKHGGLMQILNLISDGIKQEALENYTMEVIDRHVREDAWSDKVDVMRDVLTEFGHLLPESIRKLPPEQLAGHYRDVLRDLIDAISESAGIFRRV